MDLQVRELFALQQLLNRAQQKLATNDNTGWKDILQVSSTLSVFKIPNQGVQKFRSYLKVADPEPEAPAPVAAEQPKKTEDKKEDAKETEKKKKGKKAADNVKKDKKGLDEGSYAKEVVEQKEQSVGSHTETKEASAGANSVESSILEPSASEKSDYPAKKKKKAKKASEEQPAPAEPQPEEAKTEPEAQSIISEAESSVQESSAEKTGQPAKKKKKAKKAGDAQPDLYAEAVPTSSAAETPVVESLQVQQTPSLTEFQDVTSNAASQFQQVDNLVLSIISNLAAKKRRPVKPPNRSFLITRPLAGYDDAQAASSAKALFSDLMKRHPLM